MTSTKQRRRAKRHVTRVVEAPNEANGFDESLPVGLFEEVLAQPHSDDPRRVYADWLAERGNPRGEFIAVQCELARTFDAVLAERERVLLVEHGVRWIAELGLRMRERPVPGEPPMVVFHRGFPDRIEVDIAELATAPVDRLPLRHLVVNGLRDETVGSLIARPAITGVTAFGLRDARLGPEALLRLGEAPLMTSAELLGFHRGRFNDMANLATVALPGLRSLHLDDVNARNIDALADAVWLPQIRSLRIRDTHTIAIGRLLRSRLWQLTELTIETSMPDFTLAWLATSNVASTIERLDLAIGYGDAKTIKAFSTSELPRLETFVVRGKARDEDLEPLRKRWGDRLTVQR